jgi:hypothetical protein
LGSPNFRSTCSSTGRRASRSAPCAAYLSTSYGPRGSKRRKVKARLKARQATVRQTDAAVPSASPRPFHPAGSRLARSQMVGSHLARSHLVGSHLARSHLVGSHLARSRPADDPGRSRTARRLRAAARRSRAAAAASAAHGSARPAGGPRLQPQSTVSCRCGLATAAVHQRLSDSFAAADTAWAARVT